MFFLRVVPIYPAVPCCRAVRGVVVCLLVSAVVLFSVVGSAVAKPSSTPFGIFPGSFHFTAGLQAGAHADWTTTFDFGHNAQGEPFNDVRNIVVEVPAGFTANNTAVPTCAPDQLLGHSGKAGNLPQCPIASQVGQISVHLKIGEAGAQDTFPVYNMEVTSFGVTAVLGFKVVTNTYIVAINVRPEDYGITATSPNVSNFGEPRNISFKVWGVPASHEHDAERGEVCAPLENNPEGACHNEYGAPQPANIPAKPFLADPTSCGPFTAKMSADAWEATEVFSRASSEVAPVIGCERVPFTPAIEVSPTTDSAESSSGLDVSLVVPQSWEKPETLASSNLKDAQVTLPQGYTVNPSAGNGLAACTPQQYEAETSSSPPGAGCPPESKLGTIEIETPVLAEKINGSVYLATPYDNVPAFGSPAHPGGSLLALYVVAKVPDRGIVVKVAGRVEPDPVTGQLVSTFLNNPQQPFSRFTLKFKQGATSPLVSPPACGTYTATAQLTPWSAPTEPRALSNSLQIEKGIGGGPCPAGGVPPFAPRVISGTQNNNAGNYTPFYLRIDRGDGEQELTRFTTILPPGLTGNLTGIPFCSDAQIEAARHATGAHEINEPSCPASSEIGHTLVEAGVGKVLAQTPGKVYLAGPYHGSALSLVSVTSAKVGPFDLGTVVIRFALRINPSTAQVEVDATGSDPIPHIILGIVVHVRDIHVYIDRQQFILNPTNCNPLSITDTITGAGADPANPAGQVPVTINTPFQGADCQNLQFKPAFHVSTTGKTSRAGGASLTAKLTFPTTPPGTQANITRVKVDLPKQLPSRLTTLQKGCTAAQFDLNPAGCPAASVVGHATAITPLIPVVGGASLSGPAYFVSHGGEAFPSLIIVLQGYGITIDLVGSTFISKQGITSSTFKTVPDQPVTSFELTLPEGKFSALAANGNLCAVKGGLKMPTEFLAQNGAKINESTKISVTGCPKAHKAGKKHKRHRAKGRGKK